MLAETELFDEKQQLFDLMFQKLGDKCKSFTVEFSLQSMEEVAKTECNLWLCPQEKILVQGQLTQWIQETNRFKSLKN
jgi:hypothetical protein